MPADRRDPATLALELYADGAITAGAARVLVEGTGSGDPVGILSEEPAAGLTYCSGDDWTAGSGTCGNCGKDLGPPPRWFCKGSRCAKEWRRDHQWSGPGGAKAVALKIAHGRCQRCYKLTKEVGPLEVNHIEPRAGETLGKTSCANHQENLEALCHGCHQEATAEQRAAGKFS